MWGRDILDQRKEEPTLQRQKGTKDGGGDWDWPAQKEHGGGEGIWLGSKECSCPAEPVPTKWPQVSLVNLNTKLTDFLAPTVALVLEEGPCFPGPPKPT